MIKKALIKAARKCEALVSNAKKQLETLEAMFAVEDEVMLRHAKSPLTAKIQELDAEFILSHQFGWVDPADPTDPDYPTTPGEDEEEGKDEDSGSNGSTGGSGSGSGNNPGTGSGTGIPIQPGPGGDDPDL